MPEKRLATSPKAGYPDPSRLSELEEYVSLDILRSQYQELHAQMQHLIANAPQLEIEELAYNAHKLAGAAGMLGISDIAYRLQGCQHAAAVGDRGEATSQRAEIPALIAAFATFVAGYALK
ncbi:MAG: Hpt domain-containing protein [Paracoccaceae bacterium]|nr:Hpt domain-containing protein [Paracoccaceae bacterium]